MSSACSRHDEASATEQGRVDQAAKASSSWPGGAGRGRGGGRGPATTELLEDEGYVVLPAREVTDFGLPDIAGPELMSRLDATRPLRRVIYVSGRSEHDPQVQELLTRDNVTFLVKPIDFDELIDQIRKSG
jgi:hypothetical protein